MLGITLTHIFHGHDSAVGNRVTAFVDQFTRNSFGGEKINNITQVAGNFSSAGDSIVGSGYLAISINGDANWIGIGNTIIGGGTNIERHGEFQNVRTSGDATKAEITVNVGTGPEEIVWGH